MFMIPYHGLASVALLVSAPPAPRPHAERTSAINRLANGILVEQLILLVPLRVVAFLFFALPKSFFTFIHNRRENTCLPSSRTSLTLLFWQ
jgi:hypothetical protein